MKFKRSIAILLAFSFLFVQLYPVFAATLPLTVIDPTKRTFTYDPSGSLTEELQVGTGQATLYTYDPLSRLTGVSSLRGSGGAEAISYSYDAAGNRTRMTDPDNRQTAYGYDALNRLTQLSLREGGAPEAISFGFSTKAFSPTTGLSYFGARYYRPDLGRWLTPDPLGMVDGPNLYLYVRNNPLNLVDPWGLYSGPKPRIEGSTEFQRRVDSTLDKVGTTQRGKELLREAAAKGTVIRETENDAYYNPGPDEIRIDPDFHPQIKTTAGRIPASTERILTHEMQHATGTVDEMEAIWKGENPVAVELGEPARTEY